MFLKIRHLSSPREVAKQVVKKKKIIMFEGKIVLKASMGIVSQLSLEVRHIDL